MGRLLITLLDVIQSHLGTRTSALQELINIPEKTLERHIKILKDSGLVEYKGSKKTGGYYIAYDKDASDEGITEGINTANTSKE